MAHVTRTMAREDMKEGKGIWIYLTLQATFYIKKEKRKKESDQSALFGLVSSATKPSR